MKMLENERNQNGLVETHLYIYTIHLDRKSMDL